MIQLIEKFSISWISMVYWSWSLGASRPLGVDLDLEHCGLGL